MMKVIEFLKGKKTYALAIAAGMVTVASMLGWIDGQTVVTLYGLLGAGSVASLRAAVKKD